MIFFKMPQEDCLIKLPVKKGSQCLVSESAGKFSFFVIKQENDVLRHFIVDKKSQEVNELVGDNFIKKL